jgi:hypothetical protein
MRSSMWIIIAAVGLVLGAAPPVAADGLLIVETNVANGRTQNAQVQIEKDRMRAEFIGGSGDKQAAIFDGAAGTLWLINYDRKTYTEMTRADVERIGTQVSDLMARMQAQMASMPPAQRAQMEAMMKGRLGAFAAMPKPQYRMLGSDRAGRWTCNKYEGFVDTEKVSEICTVDPAVLGATADELAITKQLAEFAQRLIPQGFEQMFGVGTTETQGYSGIPLRHISYRNGQPVLSNEVTDVRRQSFDASTFQVPPGFEKQPMLGGNDRRQ